jgi:hypothetical protein
VDETILGIDRESPVLVAIGVVLSIVVAAAIWFRPRREVWLAAAAFAVLFALFDVLELAHQLDESNTGRAVLAGIVAALHVAVALVAVSSLRSSPPVQAR